MKALLILVFVAVLTSCDKDDITSKQELSFDVRNETELSYENIKIYSGQDVADKGFVFADSMSFSIESLSSKIINWKPKLLSQGGEGELLFKLTEEKEEYFGYYSGRNIAGNPDFIITINNSIDIRQK
jgi:hypothetical protein